MEQALLVKTTVENQEDAKRLAKAVLNARLAACAQIEGPMVSLYWWQDEVAESVEFSITFKTLASHYEKLEQLLSGEHPYDVPEIMAVPVEAMSKPYGTWLQGEVEQGP